MFPAAMHLLYIKDLKDLSVFFGWGYYRHAGPKGPEEVFSYASDRGGQAPALRLSRPFPFHRSQSPNPVKS